MKQKLRVFAMVILVAGCALAGYAGARWFVTRGDVAAPPVFAAPGPGLHKLVIDANPSPVADVTFQDGQRRTLSLRDWRGKVVVLNLWATWCAPCKVEMPTLDRLQATLGGEDFEVVALSLDRAGPDAPRRFFEQIGARSLGLYIDQSGAAGFKLKAGGLPVTIVIDREGREVARLAGTAEWDSPEAVAWLRGVIGARAQ
ncbi:MAG: TlpA disulfide reductase family protein [Hyphomicrobiales bacterium]|nr:TlpA disulfide reductase family protein [Hyphomicrobiales bacterium]